jgi:undecaprenyl-diphosphatase
MAIVAQLVRALDCGSGGRGFETRRSPILFPLLFRGILYPLQALLLGIVQGLTEFFPVSSSAHLRFGRYLLGIAETEEFLTFDLACHAGTWLALVFFLHKDILEVLQNIRKIGLYSLALLPLIPAYLLLKPFRSPTYTGYFLLITALLLFLGTKMKRSEEKKWTHVLFIGIMQGLALLPGLSRSGSTIAAGRFCKWSWYDAAKFSFLLSIPTILGGELLEGWKVYKTGLDAISIKNCSIGFIASFVVGLICVRVVFWIYKREIILPFVWYCLCVGFLMIWMFNG